MNITEYLEALSKENCPNDCELKNNRKISIAKVPPTNEILGVIISRDPTVDWLYPYLMGETDDETRHKILFASAIPLLVITKILAFMRGRIGANTEKCLFDTLFHKTYWTHLHKCQTDASGNISTKFKAKNANLCADKWLGEELNFAINEGAKFIIPLGIDAQNWIRKWKTENEIDVDILNLPHPSGQNNGIWYRSEKINKSIIAKTEEQINGLIDTCMAVNQKP